MIKNLLVRDIMVTHVLFVKEDARVSYVEELMRVNGVRHILVTGAGGKLVGLLSQRDLYRTVKPHPTPDGYVYDAESMDEYVLSRIMTPDPLVLRPDSPLKDALGLFIRERVGCIPVVNEKHQLQGIITRGDIMRILYKALGGE